MRTDATSWSALVLAGRRRGEDIVAKRCGVSHKCLVPILGVPMLVRVVEALAGCGRFAEVIVSIEDPALLERVPELEHHRSHGFLRALQSEASLSLSVAAGFDAVGPPLFVTTADHPLLTPALLHRFLDAAQGLEADVAVGLAPEAAIVSAYPQAQRTYLRFRDGRFSGANMFALLSPDAARAVAFWRQVETDRKRPWRIARAFGPRALLAYLLRRLTLDAALARASATIGAEAAAVRLPVAEAAIDVDKPADLALVERILAARRAA